MKSLDGEQPLKHSYNIFPNHNIEFTMMLMADNNMAFNNTLQYHSLILSSLLQYYFLLVFFKKHTKAHIRILKKVLLSLVHVINIGTTKKLVEVQFNSFSSITQIVVKYYTVQLSVFDVMIMFLFTHACSVFMIMFFTGRDSLINIINPIIIFI